MSVHDKAVIANAAILASATFGCGNLSPFLGERMLADNFLGKSVVVREVMPQDLKLGMDQMTREQAVSAARYLAAVVGNVHERQMTAGLVGSGLRSCETPPKSLDAPGWMLYADHLGSM
jgi:uncharacterized protein (DUF2252 family)